MAPESILNDRHKGPLPIHESNQHARAHLLPSARLALHMRREVDGLFARGEVDVVYIALPNNMHKEFTVRAARTPGIAG
jgi:predicted dehydrogenase